MGTDGPNSKGFGLGKCGEQMQCPAKDGRVEHCGAAESSHSDTQTEHIGRFFGGSSHLRPPPGHPHHSHPLHVSRSSLVWPIGCRCRQSSSACPTCPRSLPWCGLEQSEGLCEQCDGCGQCTPVRRASTAVSTVTRAENGRVALQKVLEARARHLSIVDWGLEQTISSGGKGST